jgi:hypothetical protein
MMKARRATPRYTRLVLSMGKAKSGGTHKGALGDEVVESLNTGFSNRWLRF